MSNTLNVEYPMNVSNENMDELSLLKYVHINHENILIKIRINENNFSYS